MAKYVTSTKRARAALRTTSSPKRRALIAKMLVDTNTKRGLPSDPKLIELAKKAPASGRASA